MNLSWTASSSTDVLNYLIYNNANGVLPGETTASSFNIVGLDPSTAYVFLVKTQDKATNLSTGVTVNATTVAQTITATGYVSDASLLMLEEIPTNYSGVMNPDRFLQGTNQWTFEMSATAPALAYLVQRKSNATVSNMVAKIPKTLKRSVFSDFLG